MRSDTLASDSVHIDRQTEPLAFLPRWDLEARINDDVKLRGVIQRGIPRYWTMCVDQVNGNEIRSRIEVYPAPDVATVVYWPRVVMDVSSVDQSTLSNNRMPLSYQLSRALIYRVAAMALKVMPDDVMARNRVTREMSEVYRSQAATALAKEITERSMHFLTESVQQVEQ